MGRIELRQTTVAFPDILVLRHLVLRLFPVVFKARVLERLLPNLSVIHLLKEGVGTVCTWQMKSFKKHLDA